MLDSRTDRPGYIGRMEERTGRSRAYRDMLKRARDAKKWSAQKVADLIAEDLGIPSLSGQTVLYWEQFERHPAIDRYAAWARVLGYRLVMHILEQDASRVSVLLHPGVAEMAHAIEIMSPKDRRILLGIIERMGYLDS